MTIYEEEGILGLEDEEGIFCPQCWEDAGKDVDDAVYLLTEEEMELEEESVVCHQCGEVIWGFDLVAPY